jgi:hypothetical protein
MKNLCFLAVAAFVIWCGVRIVASVHADQQYLGFLKQAADANSVKLANEKLTAALNEIERQGLTGGYTSVLYSTPDEDLGFWYKNLKTSKAELDSLPETASSLEKSNMLIKLRETLLDHGSGSESITYPEGISVFPNNTLYFWWPIISIIVALIAAIVVQSQDGWSS